MLSFRFHCVVDTFSTNSDVVRLILLSNEFRLRSFAATGSVSSDSHSFDVVVFPATCLVQTCTFECKDCQDQSDTIFDHFFDLSEIRATHSR